MGECCSDRRCRLKYDWLCAFRIERIRFGIWIEFDR